MNEKTIILLNHLKRASVKLEEALSFEDTEPYRESTIQRFEYTFELAWKVMGSILADEGIESFGVRNVIRNAARLGLLADPTKWFNYADARNKSSHVYREDIAADVYETARGSFLEEVKALIAAIEKADRES